MQIKCFPIRVADECMNLMHCKKKYPLMSTGLKLNSGTENFATWSRYLEQDSRFRLVCSAHQAREILRSDSVPSQS